MLGEQAADYPPDDHSSLLGWEHNLAAQVGRAAGSRQRGALEDLWRNLESNYGKGREGNVVRTLHYDRTSC